LPGDVDLLSTSEVDSAVSFFVNDGGQVPVFTRRILSSFADSGPLTVFPVDLDRDGARDREFPCCGLTPRLLRLPGMHPLQSARSVL
jgi:hypothetical protein